MIFFCVYQPITGGVSHDIMSQETLMERLVFDVFGAETFLCSDVCFLDATDGKGLQFDEKAQVTDITFGTQVEAALTGSEMLIRGQPPLRGGFDKYPKKSLFRGNQALSNTSGADPTGGHFQGGGSD